jgi:glucosamine--fructose-6-phosphate aminotransferase (isomerizing)
MPEENTHLIYDEITYQGQAWQKLIASITPRADAIREFFQGAEEVLFSGCGSGLNASLCAAPTFQALTSISSRAAAAAEVYQFPESVLVANRKTVGVLLSRSGQTTEVVNALDTLHARAIRVLGVTCTPSSPLGTGSDLAMLLLPVAEQAVATTRSLTGMILTAQLLAAVVAEDDDYLKQLLALPEACQTRMEGFRQLGRQIAGHEGVTRYAFVGSAPFFGLAHESQLKIKEMVLLPVDAYPVLDFRHGPQANVDSSMLVTAFLSDGAYEEEVRFLQDMKKLGGTIWAVCERADEPLKAAADYVLELNSGLSEWARAPLYLPAVQYLAYYRALSRDLNPDQPRNLSYWVDSSGLTEAVAGHQSPVPSD